MKKTLLYLFFLMYSTLYSQVITVTPLTTQSPCNGTNFGQILVMAEGGTAPYSYRLLPNPNFQSNNLFTNLSPGSYTIEVKDANNIVSMPYSAIITEPTPLIASSSITTPINCISNATITVIATGGTAPYTYSKDGITYVQNAIFDNLSAGTYGIYVKDNNGCIDLNYTTISPLTPLNTTITTTIVRCNGNSDGSITVNASGGKTPYTYSIDNGVTFGPSPVFTNLVAGTYNITVKDDLNCMTTSTTFLVEPTDLQTIISTINQIATATTIGGNGTYTYYLDDSTIPQQSNTFSNLVPGPHTITTKDTNDCIFISPIFTINTPAPLVNGSNTIIQNFTQGQTLGDLVIPGENIKWYSNASPSTGKNKKASETTLPFTTIIVDGTTYYASQTINGIESKERLAVTAKLNTLGTTDLILKNFTYYPNPIKNILTLSNTSVIEEVLLISIKGEKLLVKHLNSLHAEIDLSNFPKGVYFLRVKAEDAVKTMKLIKD